MRKHLAPFFTALMFYTRIPCPKWVRHDDDMIQRSTIYFPIIGYIVGALSAIILLAFQYIFPPLLAVIFSVVASVLATGAFHEDGFADMCDGFGGGWTKEKILSIMKDSRLGTFGMTGLVLLLSTKIYTVYCLVIVLDKTSILLTLISAHAISRSIAASTIFTHPYARESLDSKAKPVSKGINVSQLLLVIVGGLFPLSILYIISPSYWLTGIPVILYVVKIFLTRFYVKWIGGYTGDCLGATQQIAEVVFYLLVYLIFNGHFLD